MLAALGVGVLLAPAAGAATRHATVLSVNRTAHTLRVVGANHQAKTFKVKGRVSRKVTTGAKVAFRVRGRVASHLRVVGASRKVTVKGRVTRTHRIRLADGGSLKVGNVIVTLVGFRAGQRVAVTVAITDAGDVNVIVKLDDEHGHCTANCPVEVEGHVTGFVDTPGAESITVDSGEDGGTPYTFSVTAEQLAQVKLGDEVEVCAHQTDAGWVADKIELKGDDDDNGDGRRDLFGAVQSIDTTAGSFVLGHPGSGTTLARSPRSEDGTVTVFATADQLATLQVGEVVHVVVHRDGDHLVADSVEAVPPPPPPTLNIVVKVLEINAADGWFRVAGPDSALDNPGGLHVYNGSCDLTAAGVAVGDLARVHATRTAPEHWECTAIEELPPPGGGV
jgi:hypothetical protein